MMEVKMAEKILGEIEQSCKVQLPVEQLVLPMSVLVLAVNLNLMRDAVLKMSGKVEELTAQMVKLTEAAKGDPS